MSHLLKYSEWQNATGDWLSGDVSKLAEGSNFWWHVPRMLQISLTDYVLLLKDKFHAKNLKYYKDVNLLVWNWDNYKDCHDFTLFVNRESRKRKFFV